MGGKKHKQNATWMSGKHRSEEPGPARRGPAGGGFQNGVPNLATQNMRAVQYGHRRERVGGWGGRPCPKLRRRLAWCCMRGTSQQGRRGKEWCFAGEREACTVTDREGMQAAYSRAVRLGKDSRYEDRGAGPMGRAAALGGRPSSCCCWRGAGAL